MIRPALLLLGMLLPVVAAAQERVGLRTGIHQGHARLVFDWPRETRYRVEETEGRVTLRFAAPAAFDLAAPQRGLRNLRAIEATAPDTVTLTLAEGARLRHFRLGARVVVDILDPAGAPTARQPEPAAPPAPRAVPPRPERAAAPAPAARSAPAPAAIQPTPAPPPAPAPAAAEPAPTPPPQPAAPRAMPSGMAVRAVPGGVLVPASAETGAALLRRDATWLLVLDRPLPLELAEGALAGTEIATGPAATVLRIPASSLAEPSLARVAEGWRLESAAAPPVLRAIRPEFDPGPPVRLMLRAARPAEAIAVLDPETGGTLLVGTLREVGEATPIGRRAAAFEILPTRLGAAILPRADSVTLRALPNGFAAAPGAGMALALGPEAMEEAEGLSRIFDLPNEPLAALVQRERNAMLAIAAAPPLARGLPRLRAAEALLALGLGAEAQAMAALALREDPRAAEDPRAQALHGAAALLAGRVREAQGLLHPRLPLGDEVALWRALLAASRGEDNAETAAALAAGLPILRSWPQPLRERLAPLAAEVLAAREPPAARRLLAGREADAAYALARARLLESTGETEQALAAYDTLREGRDRRARAIAMRRAAELRLESGALDAAGAAAALEAVLAAWRGDAMESAVRLRLAELRIEAGAPRAAFDLLRETAEAFPDLAAALRPRQQAALLAALGAESPLAAVARFDAHHALLPAGAPSDQALATLAERLAALDLPERARAVLGRALARAEGAEARARIGLQLAELALGAEDAAAARAALADTAASDLPDPLRQARLLAEARALARQGATAEAAARYREAGPLAGAELAEVLAARQDWAGAAAALLGHLETTLPAPGEALDAAARRLVARAAALLALAGDEAGLAALREREAPRMSGGAFEEAFGLLTSARLSGADDLPRARRELELARALPARLEALRNGEAPAR